MAGTATDRYLREYNSRPLAERQARERRALAFRQHLERDQAEATAPPAAAPSPARRPASTRRSSQARPNEPVRRSEQARRSEAPAATRRTDRPFKAAPPNVLPAPAGQDSLALSSEALQMIGGGFSMDNLFNMLTVLAKKLEAVAEGEQLAPEVSDYGKW